MKEYRTAVGNRIFEVNTDKQTAVERLWFISTIFPNLPVRLVTKDFKDMKYSPVYVCGEKIR